MKKDVKDSPIGSFIVCTPEGRDGDVIFVGRAVTAGKLQKECRVHMKPGRPKPRMSSMIGVKIKIIY